MSKTIAVVGFGPGISTGVAERFGAAGFAVGLVARGADKLAAGVATLGGKGIKAGAFPADAGDPASIRAAIGRIHAELGPLTVLHWNAFGGGASGDLLTSDPVSVTQDIAGVGIGGLLAAVQAALPDLKSAGEGAVLVTNGGFGLSTPQVDAMAVGMRSMGVALANTAKDRLVGLLAERLKGEGVYVGQVMVNGAVKGTPFAGSGGGIDPAAIADKFWGLYETRGEIRTQIA